MRRRCRLFAIGLAVAVTLCADEPLTAPENRKIQSLNKKYCAYLDSARNLTTVYQTRAKGKPVKLWEMPGWFRVAALSNDGESLVVGFEGSNLLDLNYRKDQVMLSFYRRGKLIRSVTLAELLDDFSHLRRTESHFFWGSYLGFDRSNHYLVETVEKRTIAFDVTTGQPIRTP